MRYNEKLILSINSSGIWKSKFLYANSILFTLTLFLNVNSIPKGVFSIIIALYVFWTSALLVITFFKLAPNFTRVLQAPGSVKLPGKKVGNFVSKTIILVFFIWILVCFNFVLNWIDPQLLPSETLKPGVESVINSIFAGPIEETWRWTFVLALFYLGTRLFKKALPTIVFWVSVAISCVLFGVGHIGQLKGHDFATWLIATLTGLFLFLYAYFSRSFWMDVFAHSLYDVAASIGAISISQSWWTYLAIPWFIIGVLYYKWRMSKTVHMDNPVEVTQ